MSENIPSSSEVVSSPEVDTSTADTVTENSEGLDTSAESSDGVEAEVEALESKPKLSAPEKKYLRELKLKIDGKEVIEKLPFDLEDTDANRDYMTKQFQLARVAQKRMAESSDLKKQMDSVAEYLQQAKGNPKKIRELMKDLSVDERELAAMIVEDEIAKSKKTPAELKQEELQQELQKMKDERTQEKKELEEREYQRLVQTETERYDQQITQALNTSSLPKSPYVVKKIADYMVRALDRGMEVSAEDIIPIVKQEIEDDVRTMFSASPEDFIEQLLGKDNMKRLRASNLKKGKAAPPVPLNKQVSDTGVNKGQKSKEVPRVSMKDYFRKL